MSVVLPRSLLCSYTPSNPVFLSSLAHLETMVSYSFCLSSILSGFELTPTSLREPEKRDS